MKAARVILWVLSVAAAFAVGRLAPRDGASRELGTVASFRDALAERDELERSYRMSAFFKELGPEDLPATLEALEQDNVGVTREEVRLLMLAWSRFDAPGAFAWARAWPTQWSDALTEQAIYSWGFRDPAAARAALEAIGEPELQARLRRPFLEGWVHRSDRTGAAEFIASVQEPRQRGRLAFLLVAETLRDGPDAVIRWADGVPDDAPNDFKKGAFNLAAMLLAREDPRRAAEWFEAHETRAYSAGALDGIARGWAESGEAAELFDWLWSRPSDGRDADEIDEAVASGFRIWVGKAPDAAEAWLSSRPPDPRLDPAIGELVRARSGSSPASALEWAVRIRDEGLRGRMTVQAALSWQRQDPEAVREWLARSDLSEDAKQSILRARAAGQRAAARSAPLIPSR